MRDLTARFANASQGLLSRLPLPVASPLFTGIADRAVKTASNPAIRPRILGAGLGLATLGQLWLWVAASSPPAPGVAVVALISGTLIFTALSGPPAIAFASIPLVTAGFPWQGALSKRAGRWTAAAGSILFIALLQALVAGADEGWYLLPWLAAIGLIGVSFIGGPVAKPRLPVPSSVREALLVGIVVAAFIAINAWDLTDWYYSAIGDEYAFYLDARHMAERGVSRPFSQAGVYGKHPVLGTAYQALVMAWAGIDNFGWKFSSVLAVAAAIPGVYVVARTLGNRSLAILSMSFFASSHYLFAYAHTGYDNIQSIVPAVWAVAALILGIRHRSPLALYLAGVIAGLGFYTFFSARSAFLILIFIALTLVRSRRGMSVFVPSITGFVLAAAPIFAASGWETISRMAEEIPGGYSATVTGPAGLRIIQNFSRNLLAFNYNPDIHHYVSGALLDPVTGLLSVLGIGLAVKSVHVPASRLLIFWILLAVISTGVLSPYPTVAISRLNYALPPLAIVAALCVSHLLAQPTGRLAFMRHRRSKVLALTPLMLLVLGLNVHRFWIGTPSVFPLTPAAISVGALNSKACGGKTEQVLFVGQGVEAPLKPALQSYSPWGAGVHLLEDYARIGDAARRVRPLQCVIFAFPNQPGAAKAVSELSTAYPAGKGEYFSDRAQKGRVWVFALPPQGAPRALLPSLRHPEGLR